MKLKVDIDNVIRDMGSEMVRLYNEQYLWRLPNPITKEDISDYDVSVAFPLLKENGVNPRKFFFEDHRPDLYLDAKPMEGAVEGLKLAKELGYEIIIVSYQPYTLTKKYTLTWLDENQIPYDSIVFTNKDDKTIISADYIIDDNPKFLDEDDAKTVCIDWAYNRNKEYDYRYKSIYEFVNNILNK